MSNIPNLMQVQYVNNDTDHIKINKELYVVDSAVSVFKAPRHGFDCKVDLLVMDRSSIGEGKERLAIDHPSFRPSDANANLTSGYYTLLYLSGTLRIMRIDR